MFTGSAVLLMLCVLTHAHVSPLRQAAPWRQDQASSKSKPLEPPQPPSKPFQPPHRHFKAAPPSRPEVWPYPASIERDDQASLTLAEDFSFANHGGDCPKIERAEERAKAAIGKIPATSQQSMHSTTDSTVSVVTVSYDSCEDTPYMGMDESYVIKLSQAGAQLHAPSVWGALYALESFAQLVARGAGGLSLPVLTIRDQPRFAHRGFLIDTSRHYLPTSAIYEMIDLLALNKFNVFHWHIVDDQSFPYESAVYPDISADGAYPGELTYSAETVAAVVDYATDRGVRVMAEFDTPGHTQSWGHGQPGLLTECYGADGKPNGNYGPIDPTKPSTYTFLEGLFGEVAARFPDHYLHLGGDEVSFSCWESNPSISDFMTKNNISDYEGLEEYYFNKLLPIISNLPDPKGYVVWQEVFDNKVSLASDTVINVWKSDTGKLKEVTEAGYSAIYSTCWYLDYISYGVDYEQYYNCDPLAFDGTDAQKALVMGGTACIWAEYVDRTNIVPRTFPRGSAVAERLWSPEAVTSQGGQAAGGRLEQHRCRMYNRGYAVQPLWPSYCPADAN